MTKKLIILALCLVLTAGTSLLLLRRGADVAPSAEGETNVR